MEEADEELLLYSFGLLGCIFCFVFFGLWNCIENGILTQRGILKKRRTVRDCNHDVCQSRHHCSMVCRYCRDDSYLPTRMAFNFSAAPQRAVSTSETRMAGIPSYREAMFAIRGEEEMSLPSYEAAVASNECWSLPPAYCELPISEEPDLCETPV
jgi:hypothetical protein